MLDGQLVLLNLTSELTEMVSVMEVGLFSGVILIEKSKGTGKKSNNRQFDTYGEPYGKGDVIGCYIDIDKGMIAFTKNGKLKKFLR